MCFGETTFNDVHQRVARKVGVNERHDGSDARYTQPDRHVFRAIWHNQADNIALGDTLPQSPARVLLGAFRQSLVDQPSWSAGQRRRGAAVLGQTPDQYWQGLPRLLRDGCCPFKRTQPCFSNRAEMIA